MNNAGVFLGTLLVAAAAGSMSVLIGAAQPATPAEREVRAFAESIDAALEKRDRAALERILADGFEFLHSTGRVEGRASYLDRAARGDLASQRNPGNRLETRLRIYNDVTAIWKMRTTVRVSQAEGQSGETEIITLHVYVKTEHQWQWVSAQSTPVQSASPPGF